MRNQNKNILNYCWDAREKKVKLIDQRKRYMTDIIEYFPFNNLYNRFESKESFQQFDDSLNYAFFETIRKRNLSFDEGIYNLCCQDQSIIVILTNIITEVPIGLLGNIPDREAEIEKYINFYTMIIPLVSGCYKCVIV